MSAASSEPAKQEVVKETKVEEVAQKPAEQPAEEEEEMDMGGLFDWSWGYLNIS